MHTEGSQWYTQQNGAKVEAEDRTLIIDGDKPSALGSGRTTS